MSNIVRLANGNVVYWVNLDQVVYAKESPNGGCYLKLTGEQGLNVDEPASKIAQLCDRLAKPASARPG